MTVSTKSRNIAAGLLAACGLASLSPVQQAAMGVAAVGVVGMASPARAQTGIPGVGIVVKSGLKGGSVIVALLAPSDANGNVVLTGLEPGEYEVKLIGAEEFITVPVGRDGRLAVTAWQDKGRQWVAPARRGVRGRAIDVPRTFSVTPPTPCARPAPGMDRNPACRGAVMNYIDVNTSSAEDIVRLAPGTSLDAARFLVEERQRGGKFKAGADLAQRVCPKVAIDFGLAPVAIGDDRIIARSDNPRASGWKCAPGEPVIELYGKKHNYVGHVTLLR